MTWDRINCFFNATFNIFRRSFRGGKVLLTYDTGVPVENRRTDGLSDTHWSKSCDLVHDTLLTFATDAQIESRRSAYQTGLGLA